jgi:methionine synthase I (cobalamin-dependent)/5,10-methylenetetrahydrofolate reductase
MMKKKQTFWELLASGEPILLDGAMGTELYQRGIFINRSFEDVNIVQPQLVLGLHQDYKKAGAMALSTNTWGGNRMKLKGHNLDHRLGEINRQGVRLAKQAAGDDLYVVGCVGPLGVPIEPFGPTSYGEARQIFEEQIGHLIEEGVDVISLETFDDLAQLKEAILASKTINPDIPIIAHVIMTPEGTLPYGTPIPWVMEQLELWQADVVGLNCSVGPGPMLSMVEKIKNSIRKPICIQPNAGLPKVVEGRQIYMSTPEYMAHYAKAFYQAGVRIIGGCCGSSPEHIRAMAASLRQAKAFHKGSQIFESRPQEKTQLSGGEPLHPSWTPIPLKDKSLWSQKIAQGKQVLSVEILPPFGVDPSQIIKQATLLKEKGIDGINIPDGPRASSRMSAIMTAVMIQQQAGIEPVLHYTCRDRNLLGMQSDMLGAQAVGLRNMLLVTGDPPKMGSYPNATGVFDVDSIGLTQMVSRLNRGFDLGDRPITPGCTLSIGVGVNPVHRDLNYEMGRFAWKVEAGAEWAITQPVFDDEAFFRFMDHCQKRNLTIPIVAGIWPLVSYRNALFMHNEVPGVVIPDETLKRMEQAKDGEDGKKIGIEIAQEMLQRLRSMVSGFQVSAPFGKVELALAVMGMDS